MSAIVIRNVVGQGPFAPPSSESEADAATSALRSLLDTIQWLYYNDARVLMVHPNQDPTPEMTFLIDTYFYRGSIIPTVTSLRAALNTALLNNPNIVSVGDINIDDNRPGDIFYHQWPEIDWIAGNTTTIQFKDNIPAGAQIELAKYTRWKAGPHETGGVFVSPHRGKRYHRFFRLGVGIRQTDLTPWIDTSGRYRNTFRARYVWPVTPGQSAPVKEVIGPLAPYGIVTANQTERLLYGTLLLMQSAPSMF